MISYLSGTAIHKSNTFIILDVQGVGYKVFASEKTLDKISENGQTLKVFCHLHVRENIMDLYGFFTHEEVELFEILNDISGVGPKAALQMASIGSLEEFRQAIAERDEKFFAGIHGIGKKKVQKIILELTGKLETIDESKGQESDEDQEVISALVNLGFTRKQAQTALSQVSKETTDTEERIKESLRLAR